MPPVRAIIRAGRTAALSNPYARAGYTAYTYGPTMARAAYKIGRFAYKSYRRRSRRGMKRKKVPSSVGKHAKRRIGHPVGKSNAQRVNNNTNSRTDSSTRTLYGVPLSQLSPGTEMNERMRGIVNCRGFQVCSEVNNKSADPIYFNMAIVHAKNESIATVADLQPNFFRGTGVERGLDFNAASFSAIDYHCNNLNTDALNVIKHKRYKLISKTGSFKENRGNSYMTTRWYVPMKRQFRYDRTTTTEPEGGHIWLVWWLERFNAVAGAAVNPSVAQVNLRTVMYYKETPLCC